MAYDIPEAAINRNLVDVVYVREDGSRALAARLQNMPRQVERAMTAIMRFEAPQAERYMKNNAPWTDRTSAARNGLHAIASNDGRRFGFDFCQCWHLSDQLWCAGHGCYC